MGHQKGRGEGNNNKNDLPDGRINYKKEYYQTKKELEEAQQKLRDAQGNDHRGNGAQQESQDRPDNSNYTPQTATFGGRPQTQPSETMQNRPQNNPGQAERRNPYLPSQKKSGN